MSSKVVIVTGASQGIGAQVAKQLAKLDHEVVLVARGLEKLRQVQYEIAQAGGVSLVLAADVSDIEQVKHVIAKTVEAFGRVDYLINNAAYVAPLHQFKQGHFEEWQKMISVNVWGSLIMTRLVLPEMISRGSGHIVFMSSRAGVEPTATLAVHSGTKHMVEGIVGSLRQELNGTGVALIVVRPSGVDTPGYQHATGTTTSSTETQEKVSSSQNGVAGATTSSTEPSGWVNSSPSKCLSAESVAKMVVDILECKDATLTSVDMSSAM